jgi:hypothetical protein
MMTEPLHTRCRCRIGIGDRIDWETDAGREPAITVEQGKFTADVAGRYEFSMLLTAAPPADAPPNSCRWCGIEQRSHGGQHPYELPGDTLRLARMKVRRQKRLNPSPKFQVTPEMLAHITVDMSGFRAALETATESMRALAGALTQDGTDDEDDEDWGDPLTDGDANWPSQGDTCAHICGPDPDHRCQAGATTRLTYDLPSGGTRSMPICSPCFESETAAKERADA